MNNIAEKQVFKAFYMPKTDKNNNVNEVEILHDKFIEFLQSLGYFRYDIDETSLFVQIKNNIIREVKVSDIKDTIKNLLETGTGIDYAELLKRKIMQGSKSYLSEEKLTWLDRCNDISFNKSSALKGFLYFKNGFVEITHTGWQLKPYTELQGLVWQKQVIPYDFTNLTNENESLEYVNNDSVFRQFCQKLAYIKTNNEDQNHDRLLALCTMLGYLIHDFTDTKMQAINFTDSKIGIDKNENNGRTGKSLIMRALSRVTDLCEIKGKSFRPESSHKYQNVSISTRITAFNDTKDTFSLESIYDAITEGYEVERKNKKPFNVIAKTFIASNRPLKINGDSDKDRVIEFEVSDYFSTAHTPSDEFAHLKKENQDMYWFFRDWDSKEWNNFYNFMVQCVFLYFKNGVIRPKSVTLDTRKLLNETAKEFLDFMQDLKITFDDKGTSKSYDKKQLFNDFILQYEDYSKNLSQRKFTDWLKKYAKYSNGFAEINEKLDEWRSQETNPPIQFIRFREQK